MDWVCGYRSPPHDGSEGAVLSSGSAIAGDPEDVDGAPPEAFFAALLAGCGCAFAVGTAAALHSALKHFGHALLLAETRPEPHLGLAFCYANLGDDRRAIRHCDACLERGFGSNDYPQLRYEHDGSDEQTWIYEIGPDQVLLWRAGCWLTLDRIDSARYDLERVSAPDAPDIRAEIAVLRAKIHLAEHRPDAVQRELSRALGWDPDNPEAHYVRGRLHEWHGRLLAAAKAYARAARCDEEAPEFRVSRARVLLALGEKQKAEADLKTAQVLLGQQLPQSARAAELAGLWDQLGQESP